MILEYWPKISINITYITCTCVLDHIGVSTVGLLHSCNGCHPLVPFPSSQLELKPPNCQSPWSAQEQSSLISWWLTACCLWEFLESFWLISLYRFNNVTAFWANFNMSSYSMKEHQCCTAAPVMSWPNSHERTQSQLESQLACHGEKGATLAKGQLERLWHCSLIKVALVKSDKSGNYKQQHTMTRRFFSRPQRRRTLRVSSRSVFLTMVGRCHNSKPD